MTGIHQCDTVWFNLIEHFENKIITQSGCSETRLGLACSSSVFNKRNTGVPNEQDSGRYGCFPFCLSPLASVQEACLLNAELEPCRSNIVSEIRNFFVSGMLYLVYLSSSSTIQFISIADN